MNLRWVGLTALLVITAVPTAWGQRQLEQLKSVQPEVQTAEWAQSWWGKRHEEKLQEIKSRGQIDLIMIGDSITHGWEDGGKAIWDKYYAPRKALNLGFSGDRTEHVIWRLQHGEVDGISPRLAVIMIGTNNAGHRQEKSEDTAAGVQGDSRRIAAHDCPRPNAWCWPSSHAARRPTIRSANSMTPPTGSSAVTPTINVCSSWISTTGS